MPTLNLSSPSVAPSKETNNLVFDASMLQNEINIPSQYVWPDHEKPRLEPSPPLNVPTIDLKAFFSSESLAVSNATCLVHAACQEHGFFQVSIHGVDSNLIDKSLKILDAFFGMPFLEEQKAERKCGESFGYAASFTNRFSSKLPWKETLSI